MRKIEKRNPIKVTLDRLMIGMTALGLIGIGALGSSPAYGAANSTTTTTLAPTVNNSTGLNLTGSGAAWFVGIIVGVLVLLLFFPVVFTAVSNSRLPRTQQRFLLKVMKAQQKGEDPPSAEDVAKVMDAYDKLTISSKGDDQATGGQNLTTALLALATLALVGLALVLLFVSSSSDAIDLRKTIITALLSILASISGFYFGARTAQVSAAQAQSAGGSADLAPRFIAETPPTQAVAGDEYRYDFLASGSPRPTYQLLDGPDWLKIDSAKGTVSGTVLSPDPFKYSVAASNRAGTVKAGPFEVQ